LYWAPIPSTWSPDRLQDQVQDQVQIALGLALGPALDVLKSNRFQSTK
jgi:hypothetical protein